MKRYKNTAVLLILLSPFFLATSFAYAFGQGKMVPGPEVCAYQRMFIFGAAGISRDWEHNTHYASTKSLPVCLSRVQEACTPGPGDNPRIIAVRYQFEKYYGEFACR